MDKVKHLRSLKMSQSLVNQGRFPLLKATATATRKKGNLSQSLVNQGRFPRIVCGLGCFRHDMSQSLVNQDRFPPKRRCELWVNTLLSLSRNPSLIRAGFHWKDGTIASNPGWFATGRNPSLIRAGFHLRFCQGSGIGFLVKLSQSLVNQGRFPHILSSAGGLTCRARRNPSLIRAGFHIITMLFWLNTRTSWSQSLVNQGRFPQLEKTWKKFLRIILSQSLVNQGRFPQVKKLLLLN